MKVNRQNIAEVLLDKQLEMIGKDRSILVSDDRWKFNNTMTREQLFEFKKYAIPLLQKVFKFNRLKAETTFESFRQLFGVRIKG